MKKAILTRIVGYGFLAIALLYAYRYRILEFINDKFYGEYTMEELTLQQKKEDFDSFYSNMVESIPFLDGVKELYDIDFQERYEYYLEEIENTENDFEYYLFATTKTRLMVLGYVCNGSFAQTWWLPLRRYTVPESLYTTFATLSNLDLQQCPFLFCNFG